MLNIESRTLYIWFSPYCKEWEQSQKQFNTTLWKLLKGKISISIFVSHRIIILCNLKRRITAFQAGSSTGLTDNSTVNWSYPTLGNTLEKKVCSKSSRLICGKNISVIILKTPAKKNIYNVWLSEIQQPWKQRTAESKNRSGTWFWERQQSICLIWNAWQHTCIIWKIK